MAEVARRLESFDFANEAIMKEYLSLLIDSDEYADHVRPGFLLNPQTKERLELDRYYPGIAGFAYNGAQHYRTTDRYPRERTLSSQQFRDMVKELLCRRRGAGDHRAEAGRRSAAAQPDDISRPVGAVGPGQPARPCRGGRPPATAPGCT